jgi:feruloyl-CoA synthase
MAKASWAKLDLAPPVVEVDEAGDGARMLRCATPLEPYERSIGEMLLRNDREVPERVFIAERAGDGWREVTYAEARRGAEAVAQALLDRRLGPARPVMVLSGNSIDHALLMLGAFVAGVPIVPVSVAYSLMSRDHRKLRTIFAAVRPGLVYVSDGKQFQSALDHLEPDDAELVVGATAPDGIPATAFAELLAKSPTAAVDEAFRSVGPDTVAKILFTSGSTGEPKGVINTHRMLCASQQQLAQIWPFTAETPPVLVDWLPWNHTFGGNYNFNLVLKRAGTLYIDGGRPAPGLHEETLRNLRDISPTIYYGVPVAYQALLPHLERDEELRESFFRRLQVIFYAAAALSQSAWERLEAVSIMARGERVVMTSAWGSTETAPMATAAHFLSERAGNIGVPVPGVEIKMVPCGAKEELRVRGPNVFPGYLGRPDLTRAAFDDDGFYRIGDAGRLADPDDPSRGLLFDGRIAEDFKLSTGTWVPVGALRVAAIGVTSPVLSDAVVTGADQDEVGLLAWLDPAGAREVATAIPAPEGIEDLAGDLGVIEHVRKHLASHNAQQPGSSTRIARVLFLTEPPSIDANEITDKGYINQRAVLERRRRLVATLYEEPPPPEVIVVQ